MVDQGNLSDKTPIVLENSSQVFVYPHNCQHDIDAVMFTKCSIRIGNIKINIDCHIYMFIREKPIDW